MHNEQGVLVVEGLMVLYDPELRNKMDIRICVDCDEDTRFMRRLARCVSWVCWLHVLGSV